MKISRDEINALVRRVLTYYIWRKKREEDTGRILLLIPEYPIGLAEMISEYDLYGKLDILDLFYEQQSTDIPDVKGVRMFCMEQKKDIGYILSSLTQYQKLEIYTPSLDFLRMLKDGEESRLFIRIALYFLMTGKEVIIRLPYVSDAVPEGRFGKSVKDLLRDMWDMGISFADLSPKFGELVLLQEHQMADFITESSVEQAYAMGCRQIHAVKNAVITPLAVERAKELSIQIINE